MKAYVGKAEWFELVIGSAEEIEGVYKALVEDCKKNEVYPLYMDMPKFNKDRSYGLVIDENERSFHVVSFDVAKSIINGCEIEEVPSR